MKSLRSDPLRGSEPELQTAEHWCLGEGWRYEMSGDGAEALS